MGCRHHSARCFLLTICILQIISTAERQVFDFLGYMWLPIITNFFHFIFVIFGFFGGYQYKTKYIIIYLVWLFIWIGWNTFIICFYLNIGILDNKADWLNFGTGSSSWWEVHGIGCRPIYPTNLTDIDPFRPLRPEVVQNCLVDYPYVETIHAGIQCCFAGFGLFVSIYLIKIFSEEDDRCKTKMKPTSIYSVEYSPQREGSESPELGLEDNTYQQSMTPRRVKRQNRNRASGRSQGRTSQGRNNQGRNSHRTRRPHYLNPVTQLMDKANESSTSTDSYHIRLPPGGRQGHSNPMYVHSRPNSMYSMNGSDPVERPPSVHSSYSNYHGQRPSLNPNPFGRPISGIAINGGNRRHDHRTTNMSGSTFGISSRSGSVGSLRSSTFSGGTNTLMSDREKPPPYMFGVNSETVI